MRNSLLFLIAVLLISSCQSKKELPILSRYIDTNGADVTYTISDFEFRNQLNQLITDQNTYNKVYLANFFFTRCPSICPKMTSALTNFATDFINNEDFLLLSFSIDPNNDSIPVLRRYAEATNIPSSKWHFLNGSDEQLKHVSSLFRTSFKPKEDRMDFYHSSYAALVDKQQYIRGFYNLLDKSSVNQLKKDIALLLE
ncbi:SCO family protein [uncultured Algibacter sp.]|uniref:SCO family protein n=1 Tax=uncultured Algibacter sp. TaxID=298659 RepID=UPI0026183219|nr:SCO family protein [uncultured Algibacter sp.]